MEAAVNNERLMPGPPIEADDVFAKNRPAAAEGVADLYAPEQPKPRHAEHAAATLYAGLGNKDKAFELLEESYLDRSLDVTWTLKPDPRIDNLRPDPRFQNLLSRVGLSN